ncbi:hypothetical protein B9Z19DRAFT_1068539 [Tuber borchii]|uniref:Uncharacterized protein n=1 Tax=Tuber borchii TaxID=42251 RepID=A0A2T6ZEU2_TUBBO|nr:hypothetical protein B9Z19DRAFT_1068539 [Tuber borchii]
MPLSVTYLISSLHVNWPTLCFIILAEIPQPLPQHSNISECPQLKYWKFVPPYKKSSRKPLKRLQIPFELPTHNRATIDINPGKSVELFSLTIDYSKGNIISQ